MKKDETGLFHTEIVTGDCPECNCKSMLVKIYDNLDEYVENNPF